MKLLHVALWARIERDAQRQYVVIGTLAPIIVEGGDVLLNYR